MTTCIFETLERRTLLSANLVTGTEPVPVTTERGTAGIEDDATMAGPPGGGGTAANPAIAYVGGSELKVANVDGSNQRVVFKTGVSTQVSYPDWFPDGQHLLFYTQTNGNGLYRIKLDGTGLTKLVSLNYPSAIPGEVSPVTGAHGQYRIAFSDRYAYAQTSIVVANADGSGLTQLTSGQRDSQPTWSPDGSRIAYVRSEGEETGMRLLTLSEDSAGNVSVVSDQLLVPRQGAWAMQPAFSQTDNRIYFVDHRIDITPPGHTELWTYDVDTSEMTHIMTQRGSIQWPTASADDTKIAYQLSITDPVTLKYELRPTIFIANSDGSDPIAIPKKANANNYMPSFKRAPVGAATGSPSGHGVGATRAGRHVAGEWSSVAIGDTGHEDDARVADQILAVEVEVR